MRDANPVRAHQTRPPTAGAASLQEKLRRGEIGGQALGLIQLVAAQQRRDAAGQFAADQRGHAAEGCN